ncbi:uncharacterized protein EV420DRAFT_1530245 [Desarmillaria tabescens]|uniref:Uncharacterized protein n=1 Tax=Armillaria tabescens TaxID=1929756 RepID=A0AA39N8R3_ARMTA|nr:uncharacterized protein EV420DRAFT_1530245 [Desarmillaria tabescens]KAK0461094.1 hypothetical protein EV420DRAFT_1530245 [Desarmillaria tabescens]
MLQNPKERSFSWSESSTASGCSQRFFLSTVCSEGSRRFFGALPSPSSPGSLPCFDRFSILLVQFVLVHYFIFERILQVFSLYKVMVAYFSFVLFLTSSPQYITTLLAIFPRFGTETFIEV